jgi:hypothetical protein
MKHVLGIVFLFGSFFVFGGSTSTNKYVEYSAILKPDKLKPGSVGQLLITLKPQRGIHINLDPPLSVILDSSVALISSGKIDIPRMKKEKFLDPTKPIGVPFTLARSLAPGTRVTLKGTLTYYYCSDAEGWCSRFKQPVDIQCTVVK